MKLNQLRIKNFNNIPSLDITDFKKINLFQGETGQGKSTIFEALNLLFLNLLDYKVEDYIRWDQKSFEVYGDFDLIGVNYKYTIKGTKDGYTRNLVINNNEDESIKNSDAVKELAKVVNARLAKHSCFAEQGGADKILFEKDTDRLNNFKQLFGIEKISGIVQLMADDMSINKDKITAKGSELLTLQSRSFELESIPELPSMNIDEYQGKLELLEKTQIVYREELLKNHVYQEQLKQYNDSLKELQNCDIDKKRVQATLTETESKLKEVVKFDSEKLLGIIDTINELDKKKSLLEHEKVVYNSNLDSINSLKQKIDGYKNELTQHTLKRVPRVTYKEEDLKGLLDRINDNKLEISLYNNKIKAVEKGKCSECGTDFTGMTTDGFIEVLKILKTSLIESQGEYEEVQKQFKDRDLIIRENESIEDKIDFIKKNIEVSDKELSVVVEKKLTWNEDEYNKIVQEIDSLKVLKGAYLTMEDEYNLVNAYNDMIKLEMSLLNTQLKDIESKISVYNKVKSPELFTFSVSFNEVEYKEVQTKINEYNTISVEIDRVNTYNEKVKKGMGTIAVTISNLQTEIDELKRVNRKLDDCKKIVDKDFTAWVISKGSEFIKKKMNLFFQRAYSKYSITFEQSKRSLNFFYGNPEGKQAPVGKASGHEKIILSIAFRVAISSLQNLGLMVLDEIDLFASDDKSRRLFQTIFNETNIDQYFIITHNESTKEMIGNEADTSVYEVIDGRVEGYSE